MVYAGPSKGCQTCRKRRVKCDETRPSCKNCLKRKRPCPGYKDGFDTVLRDETALTTERIRKRDKLRHQSPTESSESDGSLIEYPAAVGPSLNPDAELFALCFFFQNYITVPRDPQTKTGFMEYLLPLYSKTTPGSMLSIATTAVATNLSAMWTFKGPDTFVARGLYSKAVVMTKTALSDPVLSKTNDLLMTVCLLDFYDTLSGKFANKRDIGTHRDGALALVKHRGPLNFQSPVSRGLLVAVRNRLVDAALETKRPIALDSEVWAEDEHMPHNPTTELNILGVELATLQALTSNLRLYQSQTSSPSYSSVASDDCDSSTSDAVLVESLLRQALDLDRRLSSWPTSVPAGWRPVAVTPVDAIHPTIRAAGLYQSLCDTYSCVFAAHSFNTWRRMGISLLQVIEKCRLALAPDSFAALIVPEHHTTSRIQSLVDGICASIPFHLGNRTEPSVPGVTPGAEYPWPQADADGNEPISCATNAEGDVVRLTRQDHIRSAATVGGAFILDTLLSVLRGARPLPDAAPSDPRPLRLRPGQIQWIMGQLKRLQHVYLIPTPYQPRT